MNPLPITPPVMSHPRRRHQDPLDNTRRSLHHHCCLRPPSPSLSSTAAIVIIMGLVVAWCRLMPPSSSSLLSNAATALPTTESLLPHPCSLPPPRRRRALSTLLIAHGTILDRHVASTLSGSSARREPLPLPSTPPFLKTGQLCQRRCHGRRDASVSPPAAGVRPSLLGPPPPVGRW